MNIFFEIVGNVAFAVSISMAIILWAGKEILQLISVKIDENNGVRS